LNHEGTRIHTHNFRVGQGGFPRVESASIRELCAPVFPSGLLVFIRDKTKALPPFLAVGLSSKNFLTNQNPTATLLSSSALSDRFRFKRFTPRIMRAWAWQVNQTFVLTVRKPDKTPPVQSAELSSDCRSSALRHFPRPVAKDSLWPAPDTAQCRPTS
jgi:hypothetical protein